MKAICSSLAAVCALFAWSQNLGFAQDTTPATAPPESTPTAAAETPSGFSELTVQVNLSGVTNRTLVVPIDREAFGEELEDQSLIVGENGGMANVLVVLWRKDAAPPAVPSPPEIIELSVVDGNFQPRIVPMRPGQSLNLTNPTPVAVNFNLQTEANPPLNALVPQKGVQTVRFDQVETDPVPLTCNIHPWMRAYVFPHAYPFAGVTDREGRVRFENVPFGKWTVALWHENTGFFAGRECDVLPQTPEVRFDLAHHDRDPEFQPLLVNDPRELETRIYYLRAAANRTVVALLNDSKSRHGHIGPLGIHADDRNDRNNSLELQGTAFDLARFGALIQRLDVAPPPPSAVAAIPGRGTAEPPANTTPPARELRVFQFKFIQANAAADLLSQLYRGEYMAFSVQPGLKSLAVHASKERLDEIAALFERVDQAPVADDAKGPSTPNPNQAFNSIAQTPPLRVETLREQYQARDREATAAAEEYRRWDPSHNDSKSKEEQRNKLKAVVRERVAAAFAARQELQRAELEQLRATQARIERQIESRERIEDQIIDRRVEELLQPEAAWQPAESPPNSVASAPAAPERDAAPPLPVGLGHVVSVDEAAKLAEVSFGVDDGVKPGDRLSALRIQEGQDGESLLLHLGMVEIVKVSSNHSVARILTEGEGAYGIRKGDYLANLRSGWTTPKPDSARTPDEFPPNSAESSGLMTPKPESAKPKLGEKLNDAEARSLIWTALGAKLEPIAPATIANTRFRGGLQIQDVRPGGPADKAGFRRGDVLVGMQVWETTSIDDVIYAFLNVSRTGAADLGRVPAYVLRGNETLSAVLSFVP